VAKSDARIAPARFWRVLPPRVRELSAAERGINGVGQVSMAPDGNDHEFS
jgi:hypothetical protein